MELLEWRQEPDAGICPCLANRLGWGSRAGHTEVVEDACHPALVTLRRDTEESSALPSQALLDTLG